MYDSSKCSLHVFAGIHIEASGDVTVQGASINDLSSDAYLALPTHVLGVDYYTMSYLYKNESTHAQGPTQFAFVGVFDETKIIVTLARDGIRTKLSRLPTDGRILKFTVNRYQTFQVVIVV